MGESAIASALTWITVACLFAFWLAPGGVLSLRRRAKGALQVDVRLAYGPDTLYRLLDAYGPEGRRWFRAMLLADMVFPALYGATLFMWGDLLGSAFPHAAKAASAARWCAIGAAAFDYCENLFLLNAVRHWDSRPYETARLAGTFTTLKMAAFAATAVSLAVGWTISRS
jgi:hypothetical protein